jgi:hypothetical protein
MANTFTADDMIKHAKPYAAPWALHEYLTGYVPEFVIARRAVFDLFEPLWDVLRQQFDALGDRLSPNKDVFRQMKLLENKLNADERINLIFNNYRQRLWLLAHPLGNPPLLEEVMLSNDLTRLFQKSRFTHRILELVKDEETRLPGTWMSTFYEMAEYGPKKALGISSTLQVLDHRDWKAINARQEKLIKAVTRGLTQPDPRMKIVSWCMVKVQGFNAHKIADVRGVSEQQIRSEVQEANRLLGITPKKGAPKKALLPVRLWSEWVKPENNA